MFTPATTPMVSAAQLTTQALEFRREQARRLTVTHTPVRKTRLDTLRQPGQEVIPPGLRGLITTITLITTAMCTRTQAVVGISTTMEIGTAFRTAPRRSLSITTRHLAFRATSAPLRRLGAPIAGAAALVGLIVVVGGVDPVAEDFSEAVVCLTEVEEEAVSSVVVVGIAVAAVSAEVVSVVVEEAGVEVVLVVGAASVVFADDDNPAV